MKTSSEITFTHPHNWVVVNIISTTKPCYVGLTKLHPHFQFLYFLPVGLSFLDCVETSDVLLASRIVEVINILISSRNITFPNMIHM